MAQTSWGFDGTINEAQWAEMAGLLGNGYVAADASSCITTAVGGARKVSVSAGTLYGDGIVTVLDAAEEVTLTTPANGQWYVIALRREWAGNTTQLVAIAGATTTTTTPTAPPSTLPTLNADPGVLTDQPISWAWANSANTTVVVFDMRKLPQKQANPESVANVNDRDAKFPSPVQGTTVWRNDLGALQTYYGLYNVSTNPGGRTAAGWGFEKPQGIVRTTSGGTNNMSAISLASNFATSSTSAVDIPGMSITFNGLAGRLYRASLYFYLDSSQPLQRFRVAITDGSNNVLRLHDDETNTDWNRTSASVSHVFTATGSTTIKIRTQTVDAGTLTFYSPAPTQTTLVIEDIGAI